LLKVLRIDRKLEQLDKPSLLPTDSVSFNKDDTLILCAGFEDRAMQAFESAVESGNTRFTLVIIEYLPHVRENKIDEIISKCKKYSIPYKRLVYDRQNPSGIGNDLLSILAPDNGRFFVDISGMSRLLIVQMLSVLGQSPFNFANISLLYTIALEYPPSENEVNDAIIRMEEDSFYSAMFLSSGIFELTVVPELSSVSLEGQSIRLVAFPSFNPNQLAALRTEVQASFFTLIHGTPPLKDNVWRPQKIRALNRTEEITNREDVEVSTLEYQETLTALLDIYDKYSEMERIIIAPTGSKMQTVAVGIFKAIMDDIQIVYPTPRLFPEPKEYTKGSRQLYLLHLDSFSDIRKQSA
jgi:hypothetical protein